MLARFDAIVTEVTDLRRMIAAMSAVVGVAHPGGGTTQLVGDWLSERCELTNAGATTRSSHLYADFRAWCVRKGIATIVTDTAFGRNLRGRFLYTTKDGRGRRVRHGIALRGSGS